MYNEFYISADIESEENVIFDRFCYYLICQTTHYGEKDKYLKEFITLDSFILHIFNSFNFNGLELLNIQDKEELLKKISKKFEYYINYVNNNVNFIVTYDDNALVLYYSARIRLTHKEDFDVISINKEIEDIYIKKDYLDYDNELNKEIVDFLNERLSIFRDIIIKDFDNKELLLSNYSNFLEVLKTMFHEFYRIRIDEEIKTNTKL